MTIYEKLLAELEKRPETDVFAREWELGKEEAERVKKGKQGAQKPKAEAEYPLFAFKREIEKAAGAVAITPPGEVDADFAIPCFALAKERKANPVAVAKELADALEKAKLPFVASVSVAGGYVNVKLSDKALAEGALAAALGERYGSSADGAGKTLVIEYSAPNVAKPMSVGHLRSTIIGESLKRLYEFQGYSVVGINHLGDFGTQFGKLLVAYELWKDEAALAKEPVKEMLRLYVKFHEEAEKDDTLEDRAREKFKQLEGGDPELVRLWLAFCVASVSEFDAVYRALGVQIDLTLGESFYETKLRPTVEKCLDKKIAVKNEDGSVAVSFEGDKLPSFLLQKKDGSSLYATRDIAAAEFRMETFKPEKIIYVVGNEQTLHFRQVFATLESLGHDKNRFQHDGFGLVSLPEGKMSTRAGRVVFLEDLLQEAQKRAYDIVLQKSPEFSEEEKRDIAEVVGVSAIIYNDLSQGRERDITFTWERAMNMEGNSAPYLMYAYARARSILRKAGAEPRAEDAQMANLNEREAKLVRLIARFPEAVREATAHDHPHLLATHLNELAQAFGTFYNQDQVLTAEGDTKTTRLLLVAATAQTLKNGLFLLGIRTLERM